MVCPCLLAPLAAVGAFFIGLPFGVRIAILVAILLLLVSWLWSASRRRRCGCPGKNRS